MSKISTALLEARMRTPKGFKDAILSFFGANQAKVNIGKSIGQLELYDQLPVATLTQATFFTGQVAANRTNLLNSFTRPEGEHMIITGIKVYDGTNAAIDATDWTTGTSLAAIKNGLVTVSSNGTVFLRNYPLVAAGDETTDDSRGIIYLSEPIFWAGQTDLQVVVTFPVAPAANVNLRMAVVGVGTLS
jgi:hypothetical protein